MTAPILGLVAFLITAVENFIGAQETQAIAARRSLAAANWSLGFELVLCLDVLLLMNAGSWLLIPIGAGAWLGTFLSTERKKREDTSE